MIVVAIGHVTNNVSEDTLCQLGFTTSCHANHQDRVVDEDELFNEELCGEGLFGWDGDVAHHITTTSVKVNGLEGLGPFGKLTWLHSTFWVFRTVHKVIKDSSLGGVLCSGLPF